jgi:transposase
MQGYLTKEQKKELLIELRKEDKRRYADRIRVILLLDKGWTYNKIAEALFLDEGTIANYRRRYKEGGLEGLIIDDYSGRRSFLNEKEQQILSNFLQSKICLSTKEIINFIEKKFGVSYTVSWCSHYVMVDYAAKSTPFLSTIFQKKSQLPWV